MHPAFLPAKTATARRAEDYEREILAALGERDLTLTELARAMGYKGITKRLATAVDRMAQTGALTRGAGEGRTVRYRKG